MMRDVSTKMKWGRLGEYRRYFRIIVYITNWRIKYKNIGEKMKNNFL